MAGEEDGCGSSLTLTSAASQSRCGTRSTLRRARCVTSAAKINGQPANLLRLTLTLRIDGTDHQRTIEFGPSGKWRAGLPDMSEDTPFQTFLPRSKHNYERDLINRTELQVALLHSEVPRWLSELRGPHA
jgi:hypothetical protein